MVEAVYGVAQANRIGRPGQAQKGVDVHAARARVGRVGVQCKRRDDLDENDDPLPSGAVTRSVLLAEVRQAEAFTPRLDLSILATTAKRDAHIQRFARELDEEREGIGSFAVHLWFWDEYPR
ncbi:hypothetical protein KZ813_19240 [Sphingomonas sp. RHCKR7]|nr:hypothetical protein [Sphingomonas folli]